MSSASAWDAYYAGVEHPFCTATATALTSRIDRLPPGRAIDLGCGLGRHARHLAESGWSVQAVDFSRVAIEIATAADGPDVTYLVGDVTRWRPAEPVDLILVSFLHPRAEELFALLGAARTWLAPRGHLLYLGHAHHVAVDGDGPHGDFPDLADLARACEGMRIDEMAHIVRPTSTPPPSTSSCTPGAGAARTPRSHPQEETSAHCRASHPEPPRPLTPGCGSHAPAAVPRPIGEEEAS